MWEALRNFAFFVLPVPQRGNEEPEAIFKWRMRVALVLICLGGIELVFILVALGQLSFFNIGGFAMAADLMPLRLKQLENSIATDRTLQCQGMMEGNQRSMDFALRKLQDDIDEYSGLVRASPRIPGCEELIPSGAIGINPPTPRPSK